MVGDHKFKKCAICGDMVDASKLDCLKCGSGIFESEKVERESKKSDFSHLPKESVEESSVEKRRFVWFRKIFSANNINQESAGITQKPKTKPYKFINPQLFAGFPLKLLKYLFIHIPEQNVKQFGVSSVFTGYLCDTAGAVIEEIFQKANISYVTESDAGDIVQRTQNVPNWVYDQIGSLYPEVAKDRQRYPFVVRTFNSELKGRFGLLVFIYDVLSK